MPTRASSGAVSSKIRPFDNAMLMLAMCNHPEGHPCETYLGKRARGANSTTIPS
jgi:hypothetical protein